MCSKRFSNTGPQKESKSEGSLCGEQAVFPVTKVLFAATSLKSIRFTLVYKGLVFVKGVEWDDGWVTFWWGGGCGCGEAC